jgi:hypothetical protein
MILLRHIIQIWTGPVLAPAAEFATFFQVCDGGRIGGVPVYVDHTRPDLAGPPQCHLSEVLGGNDITLGRQHKVDGLARGVNGSVEYVHTPATRM